MDDKATPSPPPKRLWLSYAWTDNKSDDVDFIAQELEANGLRVHLDRWNIVGGQRLWDQIGKAITDPNESDAWALYATQSSLTSDPCIEELNYALGRALETRGDVFPLIGIFQTQLPRELIPPALRVRLYYSIQSTTWAADVAAAARGEVAARSRPKVEPYEIIIHEQHGFFIEVRPRAGIWPSPFIALPVSEAGEALDRMNQPKIYLNSKGQPPWSGGSARRMATIKDDWAVFIVTGEATPTTSCFLRVKAVPTKVRFGGAGTPHMWEYAIPQRSS